MLAVLSGDSFANAVTALCVLIAMILHRRDAKKIRQDIQTNTAITAKIDTTTVKTEKQVNGQTTMMLLQIAQLARRVANYSLLPEDIKAAEQAEAALKKKQEQDA